MAEVGVWRGDFAKHILERCPEVERYLMIDPWKRLPDWNKPCNVEQTVFDSVYKEAITKTAFAGSKVTVLRGRTIDVADRIPDGSLDFLYIDGDHTLRGITIDLLRMAPKVKEGGIIAGDDFALNPWQHGQNFEPTLVCPFAIYFAEAIDAPIHALPFNQFLIENRPDVSFSLIDHTGKYAGLSLKTALLVC